MTLGDRMKRPRQERGWSQGQLAQKLKVHQKQISGYERGVHLPSTELLIRIAALFNLKNRFQKLASPPETQAALG